MKNVLAVVVVMLGVAPLGRFITTNATVTDPKSRLMWQRASGGVLFWPLARDYCSNLTLSGYADWRLPTVKEAATIGDEREPSLVDLSLFGGSPTSQPWWTSTVHPTISSAGYGIYFGSNLGHRGEISTAQLATSQYLARCVRIASFLPDGGVAP